jgi:hypothetical protein
MELFYPQHFSAGGMCFLVQLNAYVNAKRIFSDCARATSYSIRWLKQVQPMGDQGAAAE